MGLDSDAEMLASFRAALAELPAHVSSLLSMEQGRVEDAAAMYGSAAFDVVVCHGVVMYVPDPLPLVRSVANVLRPGGVVSIIARNQHGIAVRAGNRQRWAEALAALGGDESYVNELKVAARADTVQGLSDTLRAAELEPLRWYGIRALSDSATLDARAPEGDELDVLLAAEELAGRTDPYRQIAPLFQLIAQRRA